MGMSAISSAARSSAKRGAFILFEGVDRCGKTTQCTRLVAALTEKFGEGKVEFMRFPDRTTSIGSTINAYLTNKADLDDRAIHLRSRPTAGRLRHASAVSSLTASRLSVIGIR